MWTPELRQFVREGITRGFFAGQTSERDVRTGQRFPPFRVTPRELIAQHVGGVANITPNRRDQRSILVQQRAHVDTLTHEICHFYVSNAFRDMANARPDGDTFLRGARIRQILIEGCAEHFAEQVMRANATTLGPSSGISYPYEVRVVGDLVLTIGEAPVRAAYFGGDATAVAHVSAAIDAYKHTHRDLLLPDVPVPTRP